MLETYHNLVNYTFPVLIYKDTDILTIEDKRPSFLLALLAAGAIGLFAFAVFFAKTLIETGYYLLLAIILCGAIALLVRALFEPFREKYIFDKRIDTYTFIRRSLIKSETEQGSLSQFRAVQIERRLVSTDDGTTEIYRVALLKNEGLLFGSPATQHLREGDYQPIFSSYSSEARIARAISNFLEFSTLDDVDVL